jgi:hypothetical protein
MTPDEFRADLDHFGLTQQAAGRWLDVAERTIRRWATEPDTVPKSVAMLFGVMRRFRITVGEID